MRRHLDLAERVVALSAEAIKAPLEAYDPVFETLWGDRHEADALARLRFLLRDCANDRRKYQAPVSYRILPRVIGQFRRVVAQAEEIAESSLQSVTDNPLCLRPDALHPLGRVCSSGGYHNARAYPALDSLAAACVDLCILAERHTTKLLDGRYSLLPDQLQRGDGHIGILGFVQVGYSEEARRLAQRTFLPGSEAGGFGQNDVGVGDGPSLAIARRGRPVPRRRAYHAGGVASQAFFVTDREAPPELAATLAAIRDRFPPVTDAQTFAAPLDSLMKQFRAGIYDPA